MAIGQQPPGPDCSVISTRRATRVTGMSAVLVAARHDNINEQQGFDNAHMALIERLQNCTASFRTDRSPQS